MTGKTKTAFLSLFAATVIASSAQQAKAEREGWYGGLDLGMAIPNDMDTRFTSTSLPTICDQHFPPASLGDDTLPLPLDDSRCKPSSGSLDNNFDIDNGPLLGLNVGYAWRGFRFEAEYFHRHHGGEHRENNGLPQGPQQEFVLVGERVGDIKGHQFFANVYHDFDPGMASRIIPYIGGGMGFMLASMDYSIEGHRNPNSAVLEGLGSHPAAAGTLSFTDDKLTDTLWGYQVVAGLDYPLTDNVFLGAKARYVGFLNDFKDGDPFDSLRNHPSTVGPGGDEIQWRVKADDLGFWGVSLNLKYFV
jgi:opacity protein-like surface antigen